MRVALLAAIYSAFCNVGHAQEMRGPFLGFSVGSFHHAERPAPGTSEISDSAVFRQLVGGYRFTDRMSLEASWGRTGDLKSSVWIDDPDIGAASFDTNADFEVLTIRVVGLKSFAKFALFGGLGLYEGDLSEVGRYDGPFGVETYRYVEEDRGVNAVGGIQLDLRRSSIRVGLEWFDADAIGVDRSVSTWSANSSVLFRF